MSVRKAGARDQSWIQVLEQIMGSRPVSPSEVVLVAASAGRYLFEDEPRHAVLYAPLYCCDWANSDKGYLGKCDYDPRLNCLLNRALEKAGMPVSGGDSHCLARWRDETHVGMAGLPDSSVTVSLLWNTLHCECYKSLIGLVLLLQDYSFRKSYPFRIQPLPMDPKIKLISTTPTDEKQVKMEWRLPKLNHPFSIRSELDDMSENHICFCMKGVHHIKNYENFWSYCEIHIANRTSEQPMELFSTPGIFENIYPSTQFLVYFIVLLKLQKMWVSLYDSFIGGASKISGMEIGDWDGGSRMLILKGQKNHKQSAVSRGKELPYRPPALQPWKCISEHRKFLIKQYDSQSAKYIPSEGTPPQLDDLKSAQSFRYSELIILGLNHEVATDVAFLPVSCPEDVQTSQTDTLVTCMNNSCVYPQEITASDQLSGPRTLASDIIKAVTELDKVHIIGILDIYNLGNNKVEVYLQKICSPENTS
ncbi:LOW QUALITY PROTEIN: RPA-related protein RADX [Ctenodactylus gundi]